MLLVMFFADECLLDVAEFMSLSTLNPRRVYVKTLTDHSIL